MSETALVSVVTPVFNCAGFVAEAVRSVWSQTHRPIEHIVVDDGSTDGSLEVLEELARTSPIPMQVVGGSHQGIPRALNTALEHASGPFVSVLHADDVFLPTKTEEQLGLLEADPAAMLVHCEYKGIDEKGKPTGYDSTLDLPPAEGESLRSLLKLQRDVRSMTVLFRREFFLRTGGYDERVPLEDWSSILRAAAMGPILHVPSPLVMRRVHGTNVSIAGHREGPFSLGEFGYEIIREVLPEDMSLERTCVLHAGVVIRNAIAQRSWHRARTGVLDIGRMFPRHAWRLAPAILSGLRSFLWLWWVRPRLPEKATAAIVRAKARWNRGR